MILYFICPYTAFNYNSLRKSLATAMQKSLEKRIIIKPMEVIWLIILKIKGMQMHKVLPF